MAYKRKADCTYEFWKRNPGDRVWHVREMFEGEQTLGTRLISFDRKKIYNLWWDYPYNMTPEEVEIFDEEDSYWADFFKERKDPATDDEVAESKWYKALKKRQED